jgi:phosphate:Na+ symporter
LTLKWQNKTGKKRNVLIRASTPSGQYIDTKFYVELWQPDYWKMILTVIGGLGVFLLGMKNLSDGLQAIAGSGLRRMISWVTDNRFMAVGCILTFIVQSSSATLGITIGLAQLGVIEFETAAALVLGENIGTTITAWLASLGATTNAKRAAYFHCIFNLLGVAWLKTAN